MRIEQLRLKGLTRFQQPIAIDFRDVPPGIVAVVGQNGAGKTTLLEAMFAAFYGEMPSRSDRSLVDLVNGATDAYIDVEAAFTGRGSYRARLQLDGLRRSKDAILEAILPDGSRRILTDGKVSTFDAKVAELLPDPKVLLASAFAAQNRQGSFATADRKARKDLFSALLGHQHLDAMAATARSAAQLVDRKLAELRGQIDALAPLVSPEVGRALHAERDQLDAAAATIETARADVAGLIAPLTARVATLKARDAANRALRDQHAALESERAAAISARHAIERRRQDRIATADRNLADANQTHTRAVATAEVHLDAVPSHIAIDEAHDDAVARIHADFDVRRRDLEERIANNQALLDRAVQVRADLAALQGAEAALVDAETQRDGARSHADALDAALRLRERELAALEHWPVDLAEARRRAGLLQTVPFGDRCADAGCAFVADAVQARDAIAACVQGVTKRDEAQRSRDAAAEAVRAARAVVGHAELAVTQLRRQIADLMRARTEAAHLDEAEKKVAERTEELRVATVARDAAIAAAESRTAAAHAEADAARRRHQDAIDEAHRTLTTTRAFITSMRDADLQAIDEDLAHQAATLATLTTQLAGLAIDLDADTQLAADLASAETALGQERARLANLERDAVRLDAEHQALERRTRELDARTTTCEALRTTAEALKTDLVEWQALDRVFGRNGLPVFEIDAAGPGVSAIANDLLQACFGGRFSVELVTETAKAGGKGTKETFDIRVWDAERGGDARDLSDLSGGEQVICDEALKSALSAYSNLRSGVPIETVWRDESAGALDVENGPRYMAMLRRLHQRCGLHHLFVVVHSPALADLADVQLVVADGTARLVYPPFTSTEAA